MLGSKTATTPYSVQFFKRVCNDVGREAKVLQRTVHVPAACSSEAAIDMARTELTTKHRTPHFLVDMMEVEVAELVN